ncbi:MAG TPA: glycosyltransferase family 4 protein [Galbitalea sp.]|nr:glycosyltransferase family 4 protein [Galbitalea sp.]
MTIHRAKPGELLTDDDRTADGETFAVLPISPGRLVRCHLGSFGHSPAGYISAFLRSQRDSAPGIRARVWQLFYFAEAIVVHAHCERTGIRHLHAQFADVATDVARIVTWRGGRGWSWSMALHGPVEFFDVQRNRLPDKVGDAMLVRTISYFGRSQVMACVDEQHWHKVHMVRAGLDLSDYPVMEHPPNGDLRILCVGRLIPFKGQSLLIEAVAELKRRGVLTRAVLAGDGPNRAKLSRLATRLGVGDRIELTGALGQNELPRRYAEAHVFCLPSFAEGLPVVLMEAMATGRPVVATSIMGVGELVTDRVHGRLVLPGSVEDLVNALAELAGDESARKLMGAAGRQRVVKEYDVRASAAQLREIFAATVSGVR